MIRSQIRYAPRSLVRFKSDWKAYGSLENSKKDGDETNQLSKKDSNDVSEYKVKSASSPAAPAPMNNKDVNSYMKRNNKPYLPKLKHERLAYDYPGLPNQDDFTKQAKQLKVKEVNRWRRYIPKILTGLFVAWGAYSVKVWYFDGEENSESKDLLNPEEFHKFIVTHKEQIDDDHYLIEVTPKYNHWQYSLFSNYSQKSIWDGDKIWSVEIKQPQIMVVRSYTPLPLYFMKSEYTRSGEKKPLLKVITPGKEDYDRGGVMTFYIKKYDDGEVSKYIVNKKVGDELELRGPNTEFKFPYHPLKKFHDRPVFKDLPSKVEPEIYLDKIKSVNNIPDFDNLTFYCAGTGIAPALQLLMTRNPYRGFVDLHYSARKSGELGPLERFLFFLEKLDRVKVHTYYDNEGERIDSKSITKAQKPNFVSPMRQEMAAEASNFSPQEALKIRQKAFEEEEPHQESAFKGKIVMYDNAIEQAKVTSKQNKAPPALSLVCGPDGYVEYISGPLKRDMNEQGQIGGLLGKKNWDNSNTYKLNN